jgi:general secretion pathway protein N
MLNSQRLARHPALAAPWRWAVLGAALGLVMAVLVYAPATWLAAALHEASAGRVQLIEPRGTVWTGSARLQLTGGEGSRDSAVLPGQVQWRLRPGWLALNVQVSADCCTTTPLQARLTQHWSGPSLQVLDGRSQWPAALLAGLGTPWNTVQAEGSLQLGTQGLSMAWFEGRLTVSGQAELAAMALSSRLSTLKPMGSYRLKLVGGATPTLELATIEGSLQLSGSGSWTGPRLRFEGVASATPEHEAALSNLLNIIGRRNGARSIITLG